MLHSEGLCLRYRAITKTPQKYSHPRTTENGELFEIDVRRSRRNALAKSAHPWPIFSPFDSIREAVPGQLGDLSFVVLPRTKKSKLNQLPYLGPAWYARPSVEWMLHVGLATWGHIEYSLHQLGPKRTLTSRSFS